VIGIYKKWFKIMQEVNYFPMPLQAKLVPATCTLHNFIRIHDPLDDMGITECELEEMVAREQPAEGELHNGITSEEVGRASARRDQIAMQMWDQYQQYLNCRSIQRGEHTHNN
jgi:hypothetical protein